MGTFSIQKGRNIRLKGAAKKEIIEIALPKHVAVQPSDFKGLSPRLSVKVDDVVKVGTPVFTDKAIPEIQVASPASGKVVAINRGAKRALQSVVIETDGQQESVLKILNHVVWFHCRYNRINNSSGNSLISAQQF